MLNRKLTSWLAAPVAAGAAFAIATGAFAANDATITASTTATPQIVKPSARALANFGAARKANSLMASAAEDHALQQPTLPVISRNAEETRVRPLPVQVNALADQRLVWFSVNGDELCVYFTAPNAGGPGGGCDSAAVAAKSGFTFYTDSPNGGIDFVGVVPDGVDAVRVRAGNKTVDAPVKDNVYVSHLTASPANVSFVTPSGATVSQDQ